MRIGLFGGTFDPPHQGHLVPVAAAVDQLGLDQVWFMPAYIPPHKVTDHVTDSYHRSAMLALAIQHYPKFLFFPFELARGKVSYTINTVLELQERQSAEDRLFFIMGADSFLEIHTWYQYERLIQLCDFVIINRGTGEKELKDKLEYLETNLQIDLKSTIHFATTPFFPISSTDIRAAVQQGNSIAGLVPPEVENYIARHALYRRR